MGLIVSKEEASTTAFHSETAPFLSDSDVDHHCKGESHTIGGGAGETDDHSIGGASERDGDGAESVLSRTFDGTKKKSYLLLRNYIWFALILSAHQGAITTCLSYSDTQLSIHLGNICNILCND